MPLGFVVVAPAAAWLGTETTTLLLAALAAGDVRRLTAP
jgi:hypothetical protein